MAGLFESADEGAAAIALDEVEASILRSLEVQMLELIGPGPGGVGDDPLAALFAEGPTEAPSDPALARLFPDAYGEPGEPADFCVKGNTLKFMIHETSDDGTSTQDILLSFTK